MRRIKLIKFFHSSRTLLSLALCSLALVGFSTVVYAAAATNTLVADQSKPLIGFLSGTSNENENEPFGDSEDASTDIVSGGASFLNLMSPVLQDISSKKEESKKEESKTPTTESPAVSSNAASEAANPVFSAEAERAFHDHIVKYYNELPSYYSHMCAGLNNAYATVNSPEGGIVSTSPVNAAEYIRFMDEKRQEAQTCKYGGVHIDENSKWYDEYVNVWRMYENLVNLSSVIREINGLDADTARKRLAYYSNSSGKIQVLAEFEQRYASAHL